mmetsp:Transcript_1775/g.4096  ORF Transcript_1775/g.4096 Transcript_1775/m.4096 type:complete len:709 (+) Transcript_1775:710-2836(+)
MVIIMNYGQPGSTRRGISNNNDATTNTTTNISSNITNNNNEDQNSNSNHHHHNNIEDGRGEIVESIVSDRMDLSSMMGRVQHHQHHQGGDNSNNNGLHLSRGNDLQRTEQQQSDGIDITKEDLVQQSQQQQNKKLASLDHAVAPVLARPIAPFDKTERKRAHTAAVYYSECVLQGIAPRVADKAAEQADDLHDKWWHRQCANKSKETRRGDARSSNSSNKSTQERAENKPKKRESESITGSDEGEDSGTILSTKAEERHKARRMETSDATSTTGDGGAGGSSNRPSQPQQLWQDVHRSAGTSADVTMEDVEHPPDDASSMVNVVSLSSSATRAADPAAVEGGRRHLHVRTSRNDQDQDLEHHGDDDTSCDTIMHDVQREIHTFEKCNKRTIEGVKMRMMDDLRKSGGSAETSTFLECLSILQHYYERKGDDGVSKTKPDDLVGNWVVLTKPAYSELLGQNPAGEPLYSLGRISFDMYRPTNLVCSVQGSFNNVHPIDPKNPGRPLHVPKRLAKEIHRGESNLHTYDISVAITIEEGQDRKGQKKNEKSIQPPSSSSPSAGKEDTPPPDEYVIPRPIKAILTTHGYSLRDPKHPNRLSIWFSGGTLEVQDDDDLEEWRNIFDIDSAPERDTRERANILAARVLLGAMVPDKLETDGTMTFALRRPIGGHGSVYLDVLYRDEDFRLMRGHHGSVYCCMRMPDRNPFSSEE